MRIYSAAPPIEAQILRHATYVVISGESVDPRVQRAVHLLNTQPARPFKVSELAHAVNLSTWHFSHLFLKDIQSSPQQFSRRLKLERARILLESSYLRVKEVMAAVGINDKSHFARDFKSAYGVSPTQYRHRSIRKIANQTASQATK